MHELILDEILWFKIVWTTIIFQPIASIAAYRCFYRRIYLQKRQVKMFFLDILKLNLLNNNNTIIMGKHKQRTCLSC
jgi:hypothetical protein